MWLFEAFCKKARDRRRSRMDRHWKETSPDQRRSGVQWHSRPYAFSMNRTCILSITIAVRQTTTECFHMDFHLEVRNHFCPEIRKQRLLNFESTSHIYCLYFCRCSGLNEDTVADASRNLILIRIRSNVRIYQTELLINEGFSYHLLCHYTSSPILFSPTSNSCLEPHTWSWWSIRTPVTPLLTPVTACPAKPYINSPLKNTRL